MSGGFEGWIVILQHVHMRPDSFEVMSCFPRETRSQKPTLYRKSILQQSAAFASPFSPVCCRVLTANKVRLAAILPLEPLLRLQAREEPQHEALPEASTCARTLLPWCHADRRRMESPLTTHVRPLACALFT